MCSNSPEEQELASGIERSVTQAAGVACAKARGRKGVT